MAEGLVVSPAPIRRKMEIDAVQGFPVLDASPGTPAYELYGAVRPLEDELLVPKSRYDSFSNPVVGDVLKDQSKTAVVLAGGFASRCVLGTAYGANSRDLHVLVAGDAILNPAEFADEMPASAAIIDGILGYHALTDEIIQNWQDTPVIN